jgi:uncharacterized protein YndB with AHSA1/START domain
MPSITKETTLNVPPATVYSLLTDFGQATSWVTGMKECKQTTPGAFGVGTKAQQLKMQMGKPTPVEVTVSKAEKDREIKLVAVPKGRPPANVTWSLAPSGSGTRVTETISFELPGLMKLLTPMVKGAVSKDMDSDLVSLKKKLGG